jgi:hypothetical protein
MPVHPALGVDTGNDDFCGGAVKMAIVITVGTGHFPAMLTVFCIVGPKRRRVTPGARAVKVSR